MKRVNGKDAKEARVASSREDAWIETCRLAMRRFRHVASSREDAWIETRVKKHA